MVVGCTSGNHQDEQEGFYAARDKSLLLIFNKDKGYIGPQIPEGSDWYSYASPIERREGHEICVSISNFVFAYSIEKQFQCFGFYILRKVESKTSVLFRATCANFTNGKCEKGAGGTPEADFSYEYVLGRGISKIILTLDGKDIVLNHVRGKMLLNGTDS